MHVSSVVFIGPSFWFGCVESRCSTEAHLGTLLWINDYALNFSTFEFHFSVSFPLQSMANSNQKVDKRQKKEGQLMAAAGLK